MKKELSTSTVLVILGVFAAIMVGVGIMMLKPSIGAGPVVKPVTSFGGRFGTPAGSAAMGGSGGAPIGAPAGASGGKPAGAPIRPSQSGGLN